MKTRNTLILLAIVTGLALFIFALDRRSPSRLTRERRSKDVLAMDRQTVNRLTVRNGEGTVVLRRTGDGWRMESPVADRADAGAIDDILRDLQYLRKEDEIADLGRGEAKRQKLRDFGLFKPRLRIEAEGTGQSWALEFGSDAAIEGLTYARVAGQDPVLLVPNGVKEALGRKVSAFRDHRLIPFLASQITAFQLRVGDGTIALRKERDDWELVQPVKARADRDRVTALLDPVIRAEVLGFVEAAPEWTGELGGNPQVLTLFSGDDRLDITLGAVRSPGQRLAAVSGRPGLFTVSDAVATAWEARPDALRDRRIARFNPDGVDRVTVTGPEETFTVGRRDEAWVMLDDGTPANPDAVNRLFAAVLERPSASWGVDVNGDPQRYGLDVPSHTVRFSAYASENTAESTAGESPVCTVLLGRSEQGITYGRIDGEPETFFLHDADLRAWPLTRAAFRSLDLFRFGRANLASVSVERPGATSLTLSRDATGHWRWGEGDRPTDDAAVQTFLNSLLGLRALRWRTSAGDKEFGVTDLAITLQMRRAGEVGAWHLAVGPPDGSGQCRARLSGVEGWCLLAARDVALLQAGL